MTAIDLTTATITTDLTTSLSVTASSVAYDGSQSSGYANVGVPLPALGTDWSIDFDLAWTQPPSDPPDLYMTLGLFLVDAMFDISSGWATNPYWFVQPFTVVPSGLTPFGGTMYYQNTNPAWGGTCPEGTPTIFSVAGNQDLITTAGENPAFPASGTFYCRLSRVSTDNPAWSSDVYKGNDCGGTETDLPVTLQPVRLTCYADAGRTEPLDWNATVTDPLSVYSGPPAGEALPGAYLQFCQFPASGFGTWSLSNVSVTTGGASPDVTAEPTVENVTVATVDPTVGLTFRVVYPRV